MTALLIILEFFIKLHFFAYYFEIERIWVMQFFTNVKYALIAICGELRDLVAFVQFKKREKHPWRSVNFSKVAGFSL